MRQPSSLDAKDIGRWILVALEYVASALAVVFAVLFVVSAFLANAGHYYIMQINEFVKIFMIPAIDGLFVFPSIMGGVFRGDFLLEIAILLVVKWACKQLLARI